MSWQTVKFGKFLRQRAEFILIDDTTQYKRARIQLHGKGIVRRDLVEGNEIRTKKQQVARAGDFLVAEIDAKAGGFGIVAPELDGAIVGSRCFLFEIDENQCIRPWLEAYVRSGALEEQVSARGSSNHAAIRPGHVLDFELPLPPLAEQRWIVEKIGIASARASKIQEVRKQSLIEMRSLLLSSCLSIAKDAPVLPMGEVAPLVRRPVEVDLSGVYRELGIRSFGGGTFHKAPVDGESLGEKRIFRIEAGDLLFNVAFAWEGAIAAAGSEDQGRVCSIGHLTCLPRPQLATANFLCFHFLTEIGLHDLGKASPGGAGRSRTLGMSALADIRVPVPTIDKQRWFDRISAKARAAKLLQESADMELDALVPSLTFRAFKGEM